MGTSRIRCRRRPRTAGLSYRRTPSHPGQGLVVLVLPVLLASAGQGLGQVRDGTAQGQPHRDRCRRRRRPDRHGTTLLVTGDLDHARSLRADYPDAKQHEMHIIFNAAGRPPAPPHQPIRHRSRCRVHCCPAPRAALSRELPQDRKVARVSGLWRVHGGSLTHRRSQPRPHSCTFSHISLRHRSGPHRRRYPRPARATAAGVPRPRWRGGERL